MASNDASIIRNPIISSEQEKIEAPKNIESIAAIEKVAFTQNSANDAMFTTQQATNRVLS